MPKRSGYENGDLLKCKECGADARFYTIDDDSNDFYCSKSCMKNFLQEISPPYLELDSDTFKVHATGDCSIRTIDLDHALQVARDHMPNLKYVDIFIDQHYVIEEMCASFSFGEPNPNFVLSPHVLKEFLESKSSDLVGFAFHLDDCCWEEIKALTDRCRAFTPLARMPNLKKLSLRNFGFDDVDTLSACLSPDLENLCLDNAAIGFERVWSHQQVGSLVRKLSHMPKLISLSLADIPITDGQLRRLLPSFSNRLKYLHLEGAFGDESGSPLTDDGLRAIAEHCPGILTVDVDYQGKVGSSGILALVRNCPNLVEIGACGTNLGVDDVCTILTLPTQLLNICFGKSGQNFSDIDKEFLQQAVTSTNGRVVLCTMRGLMEMNLSPGHKAIHEESMSKIKRAAEQERDPCFCNKWDGLL